MIAVGTAPKRPILLSIRAKMNVLRRFKLLVSPFLSERSETWRSTHFQLVARLFAQRIPKVNKIFWKCVAFLQIINSPQWSQIGEMVEHVNLIYISGWLESAACISFLCELSGVCRNFSFRQAPLFSTRTVTHNAKLHPCILLQITVRLIHGQNTTSRATPAP